jgi:hypothetical protein
MNSGNLIIRNQFLFSLLLLLSACSDSEIRNKASNLTGSNIRGKVILLDSNNSMAQIELLARSNELADKLPGRIGNEMKFQVQPGDLALLGNRSVFRGNLQESFSPLSLVRYTCFIMSGRMTLSKELGLRTLIDY